MQSQPGFLEHIRVSEQPTGTWGPLYTMLGRLIGVFWKYSQSFLEGLESQRLQLGLHVCPVAHGWLS